MKKDAPQSTQTAAAAQETEVGGTEYKKGQLCTLYGYFQLFSGSFVIRSHYSDLSKQQPVSHPALYQGLYMSRVGIEQKICRFSYLRD